MRLVVFEAASRNPITLFNEKAICAIGRNMVSTGRLDAEGIVLALAALKRFRAIIRGAQRRGGRHGGRPRRRQWPRLRAARQRSLRREEKVRVLTGEQEAEYAALGVLAGLPDADGLVGDLGGGSLELTAVKNGAMGQGVTLPLSARCG